MAALSASSLRPSLPPRPCPSPKPNNVLFSFPAINPFPVSTLRSSSFPSTSSINRDSSSRSRRVRSSSGDPEREFRFHAQDNDGISTERVSNPSTSFLSVLCPLLKLFSGGDPSQERNFLLEAATSSLSTLARLPWGSRALSGNSDPYFEEINAVDTPKLLQLFEFEACPFCRRVREAITELDLSVEKMKFLSPIHMISPGMLPYNRIYPCPKGSIKHREMVRRLGGKEQFPFLFDPNTGMSMYESSEIVKYLFKQYGKGRNPSTGLLESTLFTGWMPTIFRAGRGMTLWEKASRELPSKKLELFSYENNPYARIVREALCELELPYILQSVGERSQRMTLLLEVSGSKEVPYIIDPNTGTQMGDYKKILSYLFQTYSTVTA
ncbi:uncharacterized protein LOC127808900 [Diospyros lotus]|uniref:uncharacterized protein LOC127808900 n=1 Tax=Diospyros lotus TaxID=55363 RepID=UPI0022576A79|nr:uncharacterized protein LOC127808900 [Diospyros lotus]